MKTETYNPTCLITGRTDNLRMYPLRNVNTGAMIGWLFLHESVEFESIQAQLKWDYSYRIKADQPMDYDAKANPHEA